MLNLSELLALRPDLHLVRKVVYFHENQLAYPQRRLASVGTQRSTAATDGASKTTAGAGAEAPGLVMGTLAEQVAGGVGPESDRDFHFGWMQVLTALSADVCAFNSSFNRDSFVEAIPQLLGLIPDKSQRPPAAELQARIRSKSVVAYFPVQLPPPVIPVVVAKPSCDAAEGASMLMDTGTAAVESTACSSGAGSAVLSGVLASPFPPVAPLVIAWNHRWEYDKQPELLFETLRALQEAGADFRLVLLGEAFAEVPPAFAAARPWLEAAGKIRHWGYAPSKAEYWSLLRASDVVLSTAAHEFFGVAVVEGVMAGCYPLCPGALAYPEILAPTEAELALAVAAAAGPASLSTSAATASAASLTAATGESAGSGSSSSSSSAKGSGASGAGAGGPAAATVAAPQRRHPPPHERIDCRGSQHLYRNPADLRKKLLYLARRPDVARAWKATWASRNAAVADADVERTGTNPGKGASHAASSEAAFKLLHEAVEETASVPPSVGLYDVSAAAGGAASVSVATDGAVRAKAGSAAPSAAGSDAASTAASEAADSAGTAGRAGSSKAISAADACPDPSFRFDRFAAPNLVSVYRSLLGVDAGELEGEGR